MEHTVLRTLQTHNMIRPDDRVIVAVSGGADSMALLHFFLQRQSALGISLAAAHFNHGLRGADADRDEAFVAAFCERNGIMLYTERGAMDAAGKPAGESVEAWARRLRYSFLEALAAERGAKIATAHTLSDNAETLLFHAVRGSGPRGLAGIPPVRGVFIRPLLEVPRGEVVAYCKANGLDFVHDATNDDIAFTRNRMRHRVMPELAGIHPGAERTLGRLAGTMRILDDWLSELAAGLLQAASDGVWQPGGAKALPQSGFAAKLLLEAPQPVRYTAYANLVGPAATLDAFARLDALLRKGSGALTLPGGRMARMWRGRLVVRLPDDAACETRELPLADALAAGSCTLWGHYAVRLQVLPVAALKSEEKFLQTEKSTKKDLTFWADYDKISRYSIFRARRAQDIYAPPRRNLTKSIKKWMNEMGIHPAERAMLPLLAYGNRVLWVWGAGFGEGLAPDAQTGRVLCITTGPIPQ